MWSTFAPPWGNKLICTWVILLATVARDAVVCAIVVADHDAASGTIEKIVFYDKALDWWDAKAYCESNFMHLVHDNADTVHKVLQANIKNVSITPLDFVPLTTGKWTVGFWTSGNNGDSPNKSPGTRGDTWKWTNGQTFAATISTGRRWFGMQPDDRFSNDTQQICMNITPEEMLGGHVSLARWKDDPCSHKKYFICQGTGVCSAAEKTERERVGVIRSPGYPWNGQYYKNLNCRWSIIAPDRQVVQLHFLVFMVEAGDDCAYDYLKLEDGSNEVKYCGPTKPDNFTSTARKLTLVFRTDGSGVNTGFEIEWKHFGIQAHVCYNGLLEQNAVYGVIQSPNFPYYYLNNLDCDWRINPNIYQKVRIEFLSFEIQPNGTECGLDFLQLFDGSDSVGRYCGSNSSLIGWSYTTDKAVGVTFKTDSSVNGPGFEIEWWLEGKFSDICTTTITEFIGESGAIQSPSFPQAYDHDKICRWAIVADQGEIVWLEFRMLETQPSPDCRFDSLQISSGNITELYCSEGNPPPTEFFSQTNVVNLVFLSDGTVNAAGFEIVWSAEKVIPYCTNSSQNDCDVEASCTQPTPITYQCTCNPGFIGNGFTCQAVITTTTTIASTNTGSSLQGQQNSQADSEPTSTSIIVAILINLSYLVFAGWIWYRNKKMDQFYFLEDTSTGHYRYLVTIYTGAQLNGGTKSTVRINLIGANDESHPHYLQTEKLIRVFHRDSVNSFLLCTNGHLGDIRQIHFMREGKQNGEEKWFFKRILVRDLEKDECWLFSGDVTFSAFSTDCFVSVMSQKQLKRGLFCRRWENMLKDRHSLFAVTPLTNWHHRAMTRLERVSVFYLTVFMIMFTTLAILSHLRSPYGAFELSSTASVLLIGSLSPFIVAPMTHCVFEMFRLTQRQPPTIDPNKVRNVLENAMESSDEEEPNKLPLFSIKRLSKGSVAPSPGNSRRGSVFATISQSGNELLPSSRGPEDVSVIELNDSPANQVPSFARALPPQEVSQGEAWAKSSELPEPVSRTASIASMVLPHTTVVPEDFQNTQNFLVSRKGDENGAEKCEIALNPNSSELRPFPILFRFIASLLIFATIVTSTVVCLLHTSHYKPEATLEWWLSVVVGVVVSLLVVDPLKILILTYISCNQHSSLQMGEWLPPLPAEVSVGTQMYTVVQTEIEEIETMSNVRSSNASSDR